MRLSLRPASPSAVLCERFRGMRGRVVDAVDMSGEEEDSPEGDAEFTGIVWVGRSGILSNVDGMEISGGPLVERISR